MKARSLEEKVQRALDYQEIQNLMSKYEYILTACEYEKMPELFALKTKGVRAEMNWGIYDGPEGIRRMFVGVHSLSDEHGFTGRMAVLPLATPLIEVAGDGQTAKGMWIAPGTEAGIFKDENGELISFQTWCRYGIDFIKEDGKWKFWHFQVFGLIYSPWGKDWVKGFDHPEGELPEELKPDRPPTYNWMYKPTGLTELIPVPPEPYETWDGKSVTTAGS